MCSSLEGIIISVGVKTSQQCLYFDRRYRICIRIMNNELFFMISHCPGIISENRLIFVSHVSVDKNL